MKKDDSNKSKGRKPVPKKEGDFSAFKDKRPKKNDVLFDKLAKAYPKKIKKFEDDAELFEDKKNPKPLSERVKFNKPEEKKFDKSDQKKFDKSDDKKFVKPLEKKQNLVPENTRLNKYVALSGVCSRRAAADLVKKGEIHVNGAVNSDPSYVVAEGDIVSHNGKVLKVEGRKVYYIMNKPKNTITSAKDEKGRKTVLDLIAGKVKERVFPVGRLDRNTTGLLLLTNDGDLSTALAHPSSKVKKIYIASLDKNFTQRDLEKVRDGFNLEDGPIEVDDVNYAEGSKSEVIITIHIGKNRIVRRIFEHLGYEVIKLDRVYFGGLTKKDLPRGFWRELDEKEVIMLKHFTGRKKK